MTVNGYALSKTGSGFGKNFCLHKRFVTVPLRKFNEGQLPLFYCPLKR